jgi:hypothetical protein
MAGVEGAGESTEGGASCDPEPEPASDSWATEEAGDLGGGGGGGGEEAFRFGFVVVAAGAGAGAGVVARAPEAGVDGRDVDAIDVTFSAWTDLESLVFHDGGCISGESCAADAAPRVPRVVFSPPRSRRLCRVCGAAVFVWLCKGIVAVEANGGCLAHDAERGRRAATDDDHELGGEKPATCERASPLDSSAFFPSTTVFRVTSESLIACCLAVHAASISQRCSRKPAIERHVQRCQVFLGEAILFVTPFVQVHARVVGAAGSA